MKKVLIINGAAQMGHSQGGFNKALSEWTAYFFENTKNAEVKYTHITDNYDPKTEVEKITWADLIIYHTPIWWFHVPNEFKKYLDEVLTAGQQNGIYFSDGRRSNNPTRNYGTGGLLQGRKYMLTTTWNAPIEAFTLEGEFFGQRSVDDGIMFGFHKMNSFIGLERVEGMHFHDVMKNPNMEQAKQRYIDHLTKVFS